MTQNEIICTVSLSILCTSLVFLVILLIIYKLNNFDIPSKDIDYFCFVCIILCAIVYILFAYAWDSDIKVYDVFGDLGTLFIGFFASYFAFKQFTKTKRDEKEERNMHLKPEIRVEVNEDYVDIALIITNECKSGRALDDASLIIIRDDNGVDLCNYKQNKYKQIRLPYFYQTNLSYGNEKVEFNIIISKRDIYKFLGNAKKCYYFLFEIVPSKNDVNTLKRRAVVVKKINFSLLDIICAKLRI